MTNRSICVACAVIFASALILLSHRPLLADSGDYVTTSSAQNIVNSLLSMPHGLFRLPPDKHQFLEHIKNDPDIYIPVIVDATQARLLAGDTRAVSTGIELLARLGDNARYDIANIIVDIHTRGLVADVQGKEYAMIESFALDALGDHYDVRVVNLCLSAVQLRSPLNIGAITQYLTRTDRTKVISQIETFLNTHEVPADVRDMLQRVKETTPNDAKGGQGQ